METFETLFKDNFVKLCEFAYQWTRSDEMSKDVVQDAFLVLIEKPDLLEKALPVIKSFLYTTVKNKSIDAYRHSKVREINATQEQATEADESNYLETLIRAEIVGELHKELDKLPEACKNICELIYIQEKKYEEVAKELNISINTVKTQRQRAIKALRDKFLSLLFSILI
ncbi:RNA polymerase sigma-70 factor [Sphingobacterium sp. E70]|uniref:RNA polymerase sigma-70 factor n=1 Tax=Sphingobacterium sp. E70 TaxID=2853439 RepID=UPI00211BE30F|nr:RNA polymerase sigma-70 factor [Sphingobacterium sp. E70]ULT23508.1 RNA polymerase sigma-70 factor [Sphingobacterium sp. E70]